MPEFFKPMSAERPRAHPFSDVYENTRSLMSESPDMTQEQAEEDLPGTADFFCTQLASEFGVSVRTGIPKAENGFEQSLEKKSVTGLFASEWRDWISMWLQHTVNTCNTCE